MTAPPETPTPSSRYPAHLSRSKPGPSRNPQQLARKQAAPSAGPYQPHPLPAKPVTRAKQPPAKPLPQPQTRSQPQPQPPRPKPSHTPYPAPSIDTTPRPPLHSAVAPQSQALTITPSPAHEYSSLADLLQEAGYKHTRVYTPEAERLRGRIWRTLDEPDADEVDALYQAYGFGFGGTMQGQAQHRILNVTEPTIPLKSSSSLLRSTLAQQDSPAPNDLSSSYESSHGWWTGVLSKAAKAVMDVSPPVSYDEPARAVGLGLAKGGEGVRKVKSNWELDRSAGTSKRAQSDPPVPQEERPPVVRYFTEEARVPSGFRGIAEPPASMQALLRSPPTAPPPPLIEDDAYGYCPLPTDYEAQCEDDELYGMSFGEVDVGSLGSSRECSEERDLRDSEEEDVDDVLVMSGSDAGDDIGSRIMQDAVAYDESFDSPPVELAPLPAEDGSPRRDSISGRRTLSPSPEREEERERESRAQAQPVLETEQTEQQEAPVPEKRPLKYGDRATRLRMAQSTPLLHTVQPRPSWLGSIRSAFFGAAEPSPSYAPIPQAVPSRPSAPIRITPAAPAAPALVTASPVICDSTSTDSVDLPAFPSTAAGPSSALRLRPSLARLREVVGIPAAVKASDGDDNGLVLSPRLDWDATGQQFAGWNSTPDRKRPGLPWASTVVDTSEEGIDYTKSFFYKPATPPTQPTKSAASDSFGSRSSASETGGTGAVTARTSKTSAREAPTSTPGPRKQRSIKSLRAALLLPVAPPPPVPPLPDSLKHLNLNANGNASLSIRRPGTPPLRGEPPVLAISSPGAWEAGLPPRELVLEGEEWDARDGGVPGDWGRGRAKGKAKKKKSRKGLRV